MRTSAPIPACISFAASAGKRTSAAIRVVKDALPFALTVGNHARCYGMNTTGMKRRVIRSRCSNSLTAPLSGAFSKLNTSQPWKKSEKNKRLSRGRLARGVYRILKSRGHQVTSKAMSKAKVELANGIGLWTLDFGHLSNALRTNAGMVGFPLWLSRERGELVFTFSTAISEETDPARRTR